MIRDTATEKIIQQQTTIRHRLRRIIIGIKRMIHDPYMLIPYALGTAVLIIAWVVAHIVYSAEELYPLDKLFFSIVNIAVVSAWLIFTIACLLICGTPPHYSVIQRGLFRTGIYNEAREVPVLICTHWDKENPDISILEFDACGIALDIWEQKQDLIECALDIDIVDIKYKNGHKNICIYCVPATEGLPEFITWKPEYLSTENFIIIIGRSLKGNVSFNFAVTPHVLIGGSTGSGKTWLLKTILMQALHKGATIYIADFKGAVDFSKAWRTHDRCCIITEEAELLELLTSLVDELEARKKLLRKTDCANIDKYNEYLGMNKDAHEERLNRIIFACDEIGELLDKTGLPKDEKEIISRIESKLSTIARQGRAFGIHLVLATQRPDANILNGQIKNNLDVRIAGRCDNVLSQIILDNTDAADLPKDISGRFILGDGTIFQAFWFNDDDI